MVPEPRRHHCHVLDFTQLKTEEARHETLTVEGRGLLDALDLAPSPINQLAVGWTFARGEFEGLRVDRPVRMSHRDVGVWL